MQKIINKYSTRIIFIIILFGVVTRLYLILTKNIFNDELAYFNIARISSVRDILLINHWIKDHGIVYYLWLKPFILLTNNIFYLRFTNVFLYLLSAYLIFIVFKKRNQALLGLLIVFLYSFHRYFIYLNAQISPFNLVLFFSILSFLALYSLISNKDKKPLSSSLILFIFSTILGFYSDYSFFYIAFFYLFVFLWAILTKYRHFLLILVSYLFVLVIIIPGIGQFIDNFSNITFLFENTYQNQSLSFLNFIKELASVLILRENSTISLVFIGCLYYIVIVIKKSSSMRNLFLLVTILMLSLLMNAALLYLFSQHFFTLFIERSFWFFNFSLIILVGIITYILLKRNILAGLIVYFVFCFFGLINYFFPGNIVSDVSYEIKYTSLLDKMIAQNRTIKNILIVDKRYTFTVLTDYYFSDIYPRSDKHYSQINKLSRNLSNMTREQSLPSFYSIEKTVPSNTIIVFFTLSDSDLKTARLLRSQNNQALIYYVKDINSYQQDFFAL
jgi:hypothetical protein